MNAQHQLLFSWKMSAWPHDLSLLLTVERLTSTDELSFAPHMVEASRGWVAWHHRTVVAAATCAVAVGAIVVGVALVPDAPRPVFAIPFLWHSTRKTDHSDTTRRHSVVHHNVRESILGSTCSHT